jgi:hypothetical protein
LNLCTPLPDDRRGRMPVRIIRVKPGQDLTLHVAATRAATTWTHYTDKRTWPCAGDGRDCPHCGRGLTRRFEAYLAAVLLPSQARVVVAIPALAWARLCELIGQSVDGGLWGWKLSLSRPEGDIRSQLRVGVVASHSDGNYRPAGIDTPAILRRAWDVPDNAR